MIDLKAKPFNLSDEDIKARISKYGMGAFRYPNKPQKTAHAPLRNRLNCIPTPVEKVYTIKAIQSETEENQHYPGRGVMLIFS